MDGSFEPELVKKGQTRIDGVDDKIIGFYAAGLSTRDISNHLEELYGLRVSADLISRVTDAVLEEVSDWRHRKVCSLSNAKEEHLENLADFTPSAPLSRVAEVQWALV